MGVGRWGPGEPCSPQNSVVVTPEILLPYKICSKKSFGCNLDLLTKTHIIFHTSGQSNVVYLSLTIYKDKNIQLLQ